MKFLLTSFKGEANSSTVLLRNIHADDASFLELTNSFTTSERELKSKIDRGDFQYIISFGQNPDINNLVIETTARGGRAELKTTFPVADLQHFLESRSISTTLSNDAGNYFCNHIYYYGLNYIKENSLDTKMIFLHVPSLGSDYDFPKLARVFSDYLKTL